MTSQARCVKCFQPLEPDAKFCGKCGTDVPETVVQPVQPSAGPVTGTECPSCKHNNLHSARFCERCGTQLQGFTGAESSAGSGASDLRARSHTGGVADPNQSEDPWATGPGYQRQLRADEVCPRCSSYRSPDETVCVNCGLPFGQSIDAGGIPYAVAMEGNPAGFWIRVVAAIVDGIIVNVATGIVGALFGVNTFTGTGFESSSDGVQTVIGLLLFFIPTAYHVVLLVYFGTTPGKKLFNIYVLDVNGKRKLTFGRALGRELSKFISLATLLIGYIMVGFREDKRALHDLMAGTFPTVVRRAN